MSEVKKPLGSDYPVLNIFETLKDMVNTRYLFRQLYFTDNIIETLKGKMSISQLEFLMNSLGMDFKYIVKNLHPTFEFVKKHSKYPKGKLDKLIFDDEDLIFLFTNYTFGEDGFDEDFLKEHHHGLSTECFKLYYYPDTHMDFDIYGNIVSKFTPYFILHNLMKVLPNELFTKYMRDLPDRKDMTKEILAEFIRTMYA